MYCQQLDRACRVHKHILFYSLHVLIFTNNLQCYYISWLLRYSFSRICHLAVHVDISLHLYTTHTHPFNGPFPGLPGWAGTRKVKPIWILLKQETVGHMQVSILLQTDNHASTPPLVFLQDGCPSCRPANSAKALKANYIPHLMTTKYSPTNFQQLKAHVHCR